MNSHSMASALNSMILSASGWRKVFAIGGDEDVGSAISLEDQVLAVCMGFTWGSWLSDSCGERIPRVLVATDTRPTGGTIANLLIAGLDLADCHSVYIGQASAPEAMAFSGRNADLDGFAYVSASHNPVGHNGVKFGVGGGVIGGGEARELIGLFQGHCSDDSVANRCARTAESVSAAGKTSAPDPEVKKICLAGYEEFLTEIAGGPGDEASRRDTLSALRASLAERPVRIIADLNGSARCVSADRSYLESLGAQLETFNDRAGEIAHAILPEGESLEPCRLALEKAHAKDPNALIGYVPDNDGDRGNLVVWDNRIGGARRLEAQEVFALSTLAEFACAAWGEDFTGESALVVNGPTSHRVRSIAGAYGADVHEAEVGEANVVNRATERRAAGCRVRLLGEGSNGGTITHPAEVRDPLNTVTALLKLLRLPSRQRRPAPFEDWCRRIGRQEASRPGFGPADIIATLPVFTTTPTSAERALASVVVRDHGALKTAWEGIFERQWAIRKDGLARNYRFTDWYEVNNEGTASRRGMGPQQRSGACTGGLKVVFTDDTGADAGFIWMRGSGTEPVFRVMADIRGNRPEAEEKLALWQKAMVEAADRMAGDEDPDEGNLPMPY